MTISRPRDRRAFCRAESCKRHGDSARLSIGQFRQRFAELYCWSRMASGSSWSIRVRHGTRRGCEPVPQRETFHVVAGPLSATPGFSRQNSLPACTSRRQPCGIDESWSPIVPWVGGPTFLPQGETPMRSSDEQWAFQSVNDSLRSRGWAACINAAAGAQKSGDELAAVEKVIAEGDAPGV